jgi:AcrR family transcriptional regulator
VARQEPPIWTQPEPGSRAPRFRREEIAQAALAIADEEGFAAVSMRRIAERLGAGTMTLYHYLRTKRDLVALMDDAVLGEVLLPEAELPNDWYAGLGALARRTRQVLERHAWALQALRNAGVGPNALRHVDQSLAVLAHTALEPAAKFELIGAVDDYVSGNVLRAAEHHDGRKRKGARIALLATQRFVGKELDSGRYPHLKAAFAGSDSETPWERITDEKHELERFERGLSALLDGAARQFGLRR